MTPDYEKTQVTLRLPNSLNEYLNNLAQRTGISKNSIIVNVLWDFAENKQEK